MTKIILAVALTIGALQAQDVVHYDTKDSLQTKDVVHYDKKDTKKTVMSKPNYPSTSLYAKR